MQNNMKVNFSGGLSFMKDSLPLSFGVCFVLGQIGRRRPSVVRSISHKIKDAAETTVLDFAKVSQALRAENSKITTTLTRDIDANDVTPLR